MQETTSIQEKEHRKETAKNGDGKSTSIFKTTNLIILLFLMYVSWIIKNLRPLWSPDLEEPNPSVIRLRPAWPLDEPLDLTVHILPTDKRTSTSKLQAPIFSRAGLLATTGEEWQLNLTARALFSTRGKNESRFAHVLVSRSQKDGFVYLVAPLTKLMPPPKNSTRRLLDGTGEDRSQDQAIDMKLANYWSRKLPIRTIPDTSVWPMTKLPSDVWEVMQVDRKSGTYLPIVHLDTHWLLKDDFAVLNDTELCDELTLKITWQPHSLGWYRFLLHMQRSFQLLDQISGEGDSEMAQMKQMFAETSPWLLILTLLVSVAHMLFDCLAFHSDISFWRARDDFVGLSSTTLLLSFLSELVILLYLLDNDSGLLVLFGAVGSLLIGGWKLFRIYRVSLSRSFPFVSLGAPPAQESSTQEFDHQAMRVLSYLLLPIVVLASIYSLLYKDHKGWYSWALSSFASAMYAVGFILMTPQLFVNYKLKSVAHLPWHTLIYRAMNTFIDDLFAFIIKMPTMHRLAVFRDDIVFFIFLYQRWIYPTDKTRKVE